MMVSIEELEEATSEDLSRSKGLLPTQSTSVAQDEKQGTGKSWLVPAIVAVLLVILVGGGLMLWLGGEDDEPRATYEGWRISKLRMIRCRVASRE